MLVADQRKRYCNTPRRLGAMLARIRACTQYFDVLNPKHRVLSLVDYINSKQKELKIIVQSEYQVCLLHIYASSRALLAGPKLLLLYGDCSNCTGFSAHSLPTSGRKKDPLQIGYVKTNIGHLGDAGRTLAS
jgi:hypothetical protein